MFGGFRKPPEENEASGFGEEKKAYGNLYVGGRGRTEHEAEDVVEEEKPTRAELIKNRDLRGMNEDLRTVERRARDLNIFDEKVRKRVGKLEKDFGKIEKTSDPRLLSQAREKTRRDLRKGYAKTESAFKKRIETMKKHGATDRHIREEELKLKKIHEDMSSMYRRSGGSGMLK